MPNFIIFTDSYTYNRNKIIVLINRAKLHLLFYFYWYNSLTKAITNIDRTPCSLAKIK